MASEAFYTPASNALERSEVDVSAVAGPSSMGDANAAQTIEQAFDVDNTVRIILNGGYKTIGLQFPDELLPSSVAVYRALQREIGSTGAQCYVLADSTYGSCCPDVLSCLHLPADLLVHYGHACLTPTDSLPVHYVFPRRSIDVNKAVEELIALSSEDLSIEGRGLIVIWDVAFDWLAEDILATFTAEVDVPTSFAVIRRPSIVSATHGSEMSYAADIKGKNPALRQLEAPPGIDMADCVLWYLGDEGRSLINLQMTHSANALYAYSPASGATAVHPRTSRLLARRLFALHQAMSADVFGLVVGNIGLSSSAPLLNELRSLLRRSQKKSYTLSVGRLNPAKLANFAEVECFVLIGCCEGGVVDSKDFLRPIITPWELVLALQGTDHVWDPARWTLDLGTVLEASQIQNEKTVDEEDHSDDELQFSLVTGAYRTRKTFGSGKDQSNELANRVQDLTLRNQNFSLATLESAGSNFLQTRHFQGLDPRYGQDEPAQLEQGRSGIARGYTEEK